MATSKTKETVFILIGKSGNGKSSTGNAILGRKEFKTMASTSKKLSKIEFGFADFKKKHITVVDGLDIVQSYENRDLTSVDEIMKIGFSALLIVFKYGNRITEDDLKIIEAVKIIFGDNVIKDFGICIFTHGRQFEMDEETSFDKWLQEQDGLARQLYLECQKRCVLFENVKTDSYSSQLVQLLTLTKNISRMYRNDNYKEGASRLSALQSEKEIADATITKIENIKTRLRKFDKPGNLVELNDMETELKHHAEKMKEKLGEYSTLTSFLKTEIEVLLEEISTRKRSLNFEDKLEGSNSLKDAKRVKRSEESKERHNVDDIIKSMNTSIHEAYAAALSKLKELDSISKDAYISEKIKSIEKANKLHCEMPAVLGKQTSETMDSKLLRNVKREKKSSKTNGDYYIDERKTDVTMSTSRDINLLLIGRLGKGKSSTGNAILSRSAFKASNSTSAVTRDVRKETERIKGKTIAVIDSPGLETSSDDRYKNIKVVIEIVQQALKLTQYNISGLLLVMKFGETCSEIDLNVLQIMKAILGPHIWKNYGVCVLTHGDQFKKQMEAEYGGEHSFEKWCRDQDGNMATILKECEFRCILFNNKTSNEEIKSNQVYTMLSALRSETNISLNDFEAADNVRMKMMLEYCLPVISSKTEEFINKTKIAFTNYNASSVTNRGNFNKDTGMLLKQLALLKSSLDNVLRYTDAVNNLVQNIELLQEEIKSKQAYIRLEKEGSDKIKSNQKNPSPNKSKSKEQPTPIKKKQSLFKQFDDIMKPFI